METNAIAITELGYDLGASWGEKTADFLNGAKTAIADDGYLGEIAGYVGELLVAILVIGGLYWVVRRLIKAYRSTR